MSHTIRATKNLRVTTKNLNQTQNIFTYLQNNQVVQNILKEIMQNSWTLDNLHFYWGNLQQLCGETIGLTPLKTKHLTNMQSHMLTMTIRNTTLLLPTDPLLFLELEQD